MHLHDHYTHGMRDEVRQINQRTIDMQCRAEEDHAVLWETRELANTSVEQAHQFYQHYSYYPK